MARYRPTDHRDWLHILGMIVFLGIGFTVALAWVRPHKGTAYAIVVIFLLVYAVVAWFSRGYGYRCTSCKHEFQVSPMKNFFSMSSVGKRKDGTYYAYKWMVCPKCGKRTKALVLKKADYTGTGTILKDRVARR